MPVGFEPACRLFRLAMDHFHKFEMLFHILVKETPSKNKWSSKTGIFKKQGT